MNKKLKCKSQNIKILKEYIGSKISEISSNNFGDMSPRTRIPNVWEDIFSNYISDMGQSKIYEELIQLNIRKTNNQLENGKGPEEIFSKEDIEMANRNIFKKYSTSLIIKEMQIKTIMRYQFTPARIATIHNRNNKCWRGCREEENLVYFWWKYNIFF